MPIKELRERQQQLVAEARSILDQITTDTPEDRAAELEQQHDRAMAEHDRLEERAAREERLAERERQAEEREYAPDPRRPRGEDRTAEPVEPEQRPTHDDAFRSYLRAGLADMDPEIRAIMREHRAQAVGTDSAGGYTVPTGFVNQLIETMAAYSPMFDPGVTGQLVTESGNDLEVPTDDDTANVATLLAENTAATEQDMAFGQIVLNAYKYTSKLIKVSSELMQDSAVDVEAVVRDRMGKRFGRGIGAALTTGTGSAQPHGIVTAASAGVTASSGTAIGFDDLIELQHSVDPAYRVAGAAFMFNDTTLKALRKLKDSNGLYIWQPANVQTGAPATILENRYVVNQAMADIALSARSVIFGDLSKYWVRRVRDVAIRRLDERYAEADQVAFVGFARVDGELMDTAAVKALAHPAA